MQLIADHLAWAAGLFVGEGSVGIAVSRSGGLRFEYLCVQISMYDERAMQRFGAVFNCPVRKMYLEPRKHDIYKVMLRGRPAEAMLARMWPFICDTDKGDQALRWAERLGVSAWVTGERTGRRPQLQRYKRGRRHDSHEDQRLQ